MNKAEFQLQREERFSEYRYGGYRYYDTPDGKDLMPKLFYTGQISGAIGAIIGLVRAYGFPPFPQGHKQKLLVVGRTTMPFIMVSTGFTVTTYLSTVIRQKDDGFNYVYGGVVAGGLVGQLSRSGIYGFSSAIIFACVGYAYKYCQLSNIKLGERRPQLYGDSFFLRNRDFSLMPEIEGNWTPEIEENETTEAPPESEE